MMKHRLQPEQPNYFEPELRKYDFVYTDPITQNIKDGSEGEKDALTAERTLRFVWKDIVWSGEACSLAANNVRCPFGKGDISLMLKIVERRAGTIAGAMSPRSLLVEFRGSSAS